jgi:hypothetical protein
VPTLRARISPYITENAARFTPPHYSLDHSLITPSTLSPGLYTGRENYSR